MDGLFTNSNARKDFFQNAFSRYGTPACQVNCAVAFFTTPGPLLELAQNGCRTNLIVRLGYPTHPKALDKLLGVEGVKIRFLTDPSFHPKLYIFDERAALVGSSNLTANALLTNQEVNIALEPSDPRYSELCVLFNEYWNGARVFDKKELEAYQQVYKRHERELGSVSRLDDEVQKSMGRVAVPNIDRGLPAPSKSEIILDGYRSTYQHFLAAYRTVERVYKATGKRRHPEETLPLRIEIDQFFNFIRAELTSGDSYESEPKLVGQALDEKIADVLKQWFSTPRPYLDNTIVKRSFPTINQTLGSPAAIAQAEWDALIDALCCAHSFYDRLRFFKGGHPTHVSVFKTQNPIERVKRVLTYLLFGSDDYVERMGRCIFDPQFHLHEFGRSAVQEVLGWVNRENIPICNNRTLRALRYLGFDVSVTSD